TFDMSPLANPQMTLGVAVSTTVLVNVDPPSVTSTTNIPAASILRTIIPSPQILNVNASYWFSNANGTFQLPGLLAASPSGPGVTFFTLDTTTGLPSVGNLTIDSEIISYSTITLNTVSGLGRCLANSCDPLNPPAHSTFTFVNNVQVPNYVGVG